MASTNLLIGEGHLGARDVALWRNTVALRSEHSVPSAASWSQPTASEAIGSRSLRPSSEDERVLDALACMQAGDFDYEQPPTKLSL